MKPILNITIMVSLMSCGLEQLKISNDSSSNEKKHASIDPASDKAGSTKPVVSTEPPISETPPSTLIDSPTPDKPISIEPDSAYYDAEGKKTLLDFSLEFTCNSNIEYVKNDVLIQSCKKAGFTAITYNYRCVETDYCSGDFKNYTENISKIYTFEGFPKTIDLGVTTPEKITQPVDDIPLGEYEWCLESGFEILKIKRGIIGNLFDYFCSGNYKNYHEDRQTVYDENAAPYEIDFNYRPGFGCPDIEVLVSTEFENQCQSAGFEIKTHPHKCHTFYCTGPF